MNIDYGRFESSDTGTGSVVWKFSGPLDKHESRAQRSSTGTITATAVASSDLSAFMFINDKNN